MIRLYLHRQRLDASAFTRVFRLAVSLVCLFLSSPVLHATEQFILEVIALEEATDKIDVLRAALAAQLSDLGVVVQVVDSVPSISEEGTHAEGLAFGAFHLDRTGANGVVWLQGETVMVLTGEGTNRNYFSRALPDTGENWVLKCDAVASMIRSMVFPEGNESPAPPKGETIDLSTFRQGNSEKAQLEPEAREDSGMAKAPNDLKKRADMRFGIGAGYAPVIMSAEQPWLHAAEISLHFLPIAPMRFEVGALLVQSVRWKTWHLQRVPMAVSAGAQLGFWRLHAGLSLSYVLDVVSISRATGAGTVKNSRQIYQGIGFAASLGYRVIPRIELFFSGGGDVFQASNRYLTGTNEVVFHYNSVQGRFSAGVIIWIFANSFSRSQTGKRPVE